MSANQRRQRILHLLCQLRQDTIQNLAAELGVSERTIQRDIEELTLEYPLETIRGRNGGVKVRDDYRPDRKYLTQKQAALLKRLNADLQGDDLETMRYILLQFSP